MSGDTHAVVGATSALVIARPTTWSDAIFCLVFGAVGGLLLDIDIKQSKGSQLIRMLSIPLLFYIGIGFYFLKFQNINIFSFFSNQLNGKSLLSILLFIVLCIYASHTAHRKFTHSIEFIGMTSILYYMMGFPFALSVITGEVSHIVIDLLNKSEVRLSCIFQFDFCMNLVSSDGICNRILKMIATVIGIVLLFVYLI